MRRQLAAAFLSLALAAPAWGQPRLDIPAEIAPAGEYVTFVPDTDAKAVTYVGQSGVSPFPSEFLRDPRAFVLPVRGLPAGRYRFTAVGSLDDKHAAREFAVVVGQPPPVPPGPQPPGPQPPGPQPPQPDGTLGLIKASRGGAAKVVSAGKAAEAAALAQAQRSFASKVAAGGFPNAAAIMVGWRAANNAAVPAAAWAPWGADVAAALQSVYATGKLPDNAAWHDAFQEIAAGLEGR